MYKSASKHFTRFVEINPELLVVGKLKKAKAKHNRHSVVQAAKKLNLAAAEMQQRSVAAYLNAKPELRKSK